MAQELNHSDFENFKEELERVSQHVRNSFPFESNIKYGETENQMYDIFGCNVVAKDAPILLFIHGGKWQLFDKRMSCHMVLPLLKNNIRPIIADFDLLPAVTLNVMVDEIRSLSLHIIKYALKNGVKKVWICGHSSGAHLTATLLDPNWLCTLSSQEKQIFQGVVLISGLYDLTHLISTELNSTLKLNEKAAKKLSPLLYENCQMPNDNFHYIVAVGGRDKEIFLHQAERFSKYLHSYGFKGEFLNIPELDHFKVSLLLQEEDYMLMKKIINGLTK